MTTSISCLIIAGLLSIPLIIRVKARDSRPKLPEPSPSQPADPRRGQIWSYRTPEGELCETGPLIEVTDASVGWLDDSCAWCVLGRDWLVCFLRDECSEEEGDGFPGAASNGSTRMPGLSISISRLPIQWSRSECLPPAPKKTLPPMNSKSKSLPS